MRITQIIDQKLITFPASTTCHGCRNRYFQQPAENPPSHTRIILSLKASDIFIAKQLFKSRNERFIRKAFCIEAKIHDTVVEGDDLQIYPMVVIVVRARNHVTA